MIIFQIRTAIKLIELFKQLKRRQNTVLARHNELRPDLKELERWRLHNLRRDWPNTAKVTVKTGEIYACFGVRFADSYELIKQENSNGK